MPKRRLPVLQASTDSNEPTRPPWQWVAFGALAIFAVWVPLSALAAAAAAHILAHAGDERAMARAALLTSAVYIAELAVGALAGGFLVGRWGPPAVGTREAALAGVTASAALAVTTWATFGATHGVLLVSFMAPLMSALGGKLGVRKRASI